MLSLAKNNYSSQKHEDRMESAITDCRQILIDCFDHQGLEEPQKEVSGLGSLS